MNAHEIIDRAKFPLGRVVATRGVMDLFNDNAEGIGEFIVRHSQGDWGEALCEGDDEINEEALKNGHRLMSAYFLPDGTTKIWIITEWDRSVTTVLLPEEY
jgi:hypothetical protein